MIAYLLLPSVTPPWAENPDTEGLQVGFDNVLSKDKLQIFIYPSHGYTALVADEICNNKKTVHIGLQKLLRDVLIHVNFVWQGVYLYKCMKIV